MAQNVATAISGVSVSETGNTTTSGEMLHSRGVGRLGRAVGERPARQGGGGTITPSNGNKTLTIVGTLSQVNADLTTLADDDSSTSADTLSVSATDSFGNSATKSLPVTVTPATGQLSVGAPASAVIGVGKPGPLGAISLAEAGSASNALFSGHAVRHAG